MSEHVLIVLRSSVVNKPWTFFFDDELIQGNKYSLPQICKECDEKKCIDDAKVACESGLSGYKKKIGEHEISVVGFYEGKSKRKQKGVSFNKDKFHDWFFSLEKIYKSIEGQNSKIKSETLHYFHDPVKWAGQIKINAEDIIEGQAGESFKEKFNNSSSEIKSIYKSSVMLVDSVNMMEVFFNPISASYGAGVRTNVYRLFDKVQSILYHSEGKRVNKRFKLIGESHKTIFLYESFSVVALAILQNALKYSKDREIVVSIDDVEGGVSVKVETTGFYIDEDEIKLIFNKGYRGKYAHISHHDGMGIGLYVAQQVAKAHHFEIQAISTELAYSRETISMARNEFFFKVEDDAIDD